MKIFGMFLLAFLAFSRKAEADLEIAGVKLDLTMDKTAVVQQYSERGAVLIAMKDMPDTFCVRSKEEPRCAGLLTFKAGKLERAVLHWRIVDERNTAPELAALLVALVAECSRGGGESTQVSLNTAHREAGRFETVMIHYRNLDCYLQLVEEPDGRRYVNLSQEISNRKGNSK